MRAGPSVAKLLLDVPFMAEAFWRMATGHYDLVHAVEEGEPAEATRRTREVVKPNNHWNLTYGGEGGILTLA